MFQLRIIILLVLLVNSFANGRVIASKSWSFSSEKQVMLKIEDTCEVMITFPDKIPPDFLIGYTRLDIQIDDSLSAVPDTVKPMYRISLDAGFVNFSHDLKITFNTKSGIFQELKQISDLRFMADPYPMSKFHFWKNCDSIIIDNENNRAGFTYHYKKTYDNLNKEAAVKIATTGYPVNFGVFCVENQQSVRTLSAGKKKRLYSYEIATMMDKWHNPQVSSKTKIISLQGGITKSTHDVSGRYIFMMVKRFE